METLRYSKHSLSAEELATELDHFWQRLATDDVLQKRVEKAGADVEWLQRQSRSDLLTIEPEAGFDPATAAVIIAFSPVAAKITRDVWDHVILPWIKKRNGDGALKE